MRETSMPGNLNCVYATMLGCAMAALLQYFKLIIFSAAIHVNT